MNSQQLRGRPIIAVLGLLASCAINRSQTSAWVEPRPTSTFPTPWTKYGPPTVPTAPASGSLPTAGSYADSSLAGAPGGGPVPPAPGPSHANRQSATPESLATAGQPRPDACEASGSQCADSQRTASGPRSRVQLRTELSGMLKGGWWRTDDRNNDLGSGDVDGGLALGASIAWSHAFTRSSDLGIYAGYLRALDIRDPSESPSYRGAVSVGTLGGLARLYFNQGQSVRVGFDFEAGLLVGTIAPYVSSVAPARLIWGFGVLPNLFLDLSLGNGPNVLVLTIAAGLTGGVVGREWSETVYDNKEMSLRTITYGSNIVFAAVPTLRLAIAFGGR
jgi:hypothetical protein